MLRIAAAIILYLGLMIPSLAKNEPGIKIPLQYYPQFGVYTAEILVGEETPQKLEAVVDTGSSTMVLLGNKNYCSDCQKAMTKGSIDPEKLAKYLKNHSVALDYGSAEDEATEFLAPIQYSNKEEQRVNMQVFVLKKSNQPASIMGLIHKDLRESLVKFIPFLAKLTDHFKKYKELTFVLCGAEGNSYLYLGKKHLPKPIFKSRLYDSKFYEINSTGFYAQNGKLIVQSNPYKGGAIIDTGTGGFIILDEKLYAPLIKYIYTNATKKNQALNKKFWHQNYCILKKDLDFGGFPVVKIAFETLDNKTGFLTLTPKTYINSAGCGENYARIAFMKGLESNQHATAVRNYHLRKKVGLSPEIVIGTSILNEFPVHIHYGEKPYVSFFEKSDFCRAK